MARSVLRPLAYWLISFGFLTACSWVPAGGLEPHQSVQGSSDGLNNSTAQLQTEVRQFQEHIKSGPLYAELVRQLGRPTNCNVTVDDQNIVLSCDFHNNSHLEARGNPTIEFSEQRARFRGVSKTKALALLRKSERDSFGEGGCGVRWDRPAQERGHEHATSREIVYRGDICNCQGRLIYEKNNIVELVWSSAC